MHRNNEMFHSRHVQQSSEDMPPHSRLFILCSKDISEKDLEDAFSSYGNIEEIRVVKDRNTGEQKGVAYIRFSKTSEAALAMEEMNGECIANSGKPLKVLIAANREMGASKKDETESHSRLFVIVPKSAQDRDVRDYFKKFGELDSVHIVKSKETNESKGVAYVKYFKMSHAAKAYEECDASYKAVFARPRDEKKHADNPYLDRSFGGQGFDPSTVHVGPGDIINNYPNPEGFTKLLVTCCSSLSSDIIYGLFGIVPGLDVIYPASERMGYNNPMQKLIVQYKSPQAAAYARDKLHGFPFPPSSPFYIVPDFSTFNSKRGGPMNGRDELPSDATGALQSLTKALAQATSLLKAAGLSTDGMELPGGPSGNGNDESFCNRKLPSVKPLAPTNSEIVKRLFIVCQPGLPPLYSLKDVFSRFGNMVDLYILNGKNCGYVSYADANSADEAIKLMHGAELFGSRLKVMEADPPKSDRHNSRKRQRVDEY